MLEVQSLEVFRGQAHVLKGVTLSVGEGEIVAVLGANGAGKTTLVETVMGLHRPSAGKILFAGQDLSGRPPHAVTRLGLSTVPEGRRVFAEMTILDNLRLGAFTAKDRLEEGLARVTKLFPLLSERRAQRAGTLSGGQQQMLAIGRALMSWPKLLLIDELSLGLAPKVLGELFEVLAGLPAQGVSLVLIEQNVALALKHSHRAYVLESGSVSLKGAAKDLLEDPAVRKAYLGL